MASFCSPIKSPIHTIQFLVSVLGGSRFFMLIIIGLLRKGIFYLEGASREVVKIYCFRLEILLFGPNLNIIDVIVTSNVSVR